MRRAFFLSLFLNAALILTFYTVGFTHAPKASYVFLVQGCVMSAVSIILAIGVMKGEKRAGILGLAWLFVQLFQIHSKAFSFSLCTGIPIHICRFGVGMDLYVDVVSLVFMLFGSIWIFPTKAARLTEAGS